jgi:hypothetical protein
MDDGGWPELSYPAWRDTAATLQLWTQIVGKIRLALTPWLNHGWHVPLYVSARGLNTSPVPIGREILEIEFDFIAHRLLVRTSRGDERMLPLRPQSVAAFYADLFGLLGEMGIRVSINEMPNEVQNPIRFSDDREHASYDADAAHRFWRVLVQADRVFKHFRSGFLGKVSPVHFFWGSFDLAVTRFSGRLAPPRDGPAFMREAYSHEVISHGFWPGSGPLTEAAFYAYAVPEPPGLKTQPVQPEAAYYHPELNEFVLPYEAVRTAASPDAAIAAFVESTYDRAATLAQWDRARLEGRGRPG